jgi:hypothetical protein
MFFQIIHLVFGIAGAVYQNKIDPAVVIFSKWLKWPDKNTVVSRSCA